MRLDNGHPVGVLHLPSGRIIPVALDGRVSDLGGSLPLFITEAPLPLSWIELLLVYGAGAEALLELPHQGGARFVYGVLPDSPPNPWRECVCLRFVPRAARRPPHLDRAPRPAAPPAARLSPSA